MLMTCVLAKPGNSKWMLSPLAQLGGTALFEAGLSARQAWSRGLSVCHLVHQMRGLRSLAVWLKQINQSSWLCVYILNMGKRRNMDVNTNTWKSGCVYYKDPDHLLDSDLLGIYSWGSCFFWCEEDWLPGFNKAHRAAIVKPRKSQLSMQFAFQGLQLVLL